MATSSILKDIVIDDPEAVKRFIEAMEESKRFLDEAEKSWADRIRQEVDEMILDDIKEMAKEG